MDQYTSDLLCKWGLIEYVNIFADARIDITTLQLIGDTEITALISTIGDRLRLKSNLEIWKKELGTSASSELPLNPVLEILNQKPQGRAILIKGNNGCLNYDLRKQLANIIIKTKLDIEPSKVLQGPDFLKLAHEIYEIFP
ncbi:hypothetical protein ACJJTC_013652 [Scirpophaga incertulas]